MASKISELPIESGEEWVRITDSLATLKKIYREDLRMYTAKWTHDSALGPTCMAYVCYASNQYNSLVSVLLGRYYCNKSGQWRMLLPGQKWVDVLDEETARSMIEMAAGVGYEQ